MMQDYAEFLASKALVVRPSGITVADDAIHSSLFPFQRDMVRWSLRKGRAAIFADTGLGKSRMQLEWARLSGQRTLILAPLAVARQTCDEGARIGIPVTYARSQGEAAECGITITNYEMLAHFDPTAFGAVVLDESGILKNFTGKIRTALIEAFADTPYRLACTATPAPNDISELANHAEFLGVMSRVEMLASFFVHDDTGWRLKGHARDPFYRWLASWAMSLKRPSDLGYSDEGYDLPPLNILPMFVETAYTPPGQLFATTLKGITDRSNVRKATTADRVSAAVDLVQAEPDEPWLIWCGLNDEQNTIARALGDRAYSVYGAMPLADKITELEGWIAGKRPYLVTKVSIAGFGLNLQHCARMAFVGLSDSYESYYQAIRRCWRFGQTRSVRAYIVLTALEDAIYANVLRKEQEAQATSAELVKHVATFEQAELTAPKRHLDLPHTQPMALPSWLVGAS